MKPVILFSSILLSLCSLMLQANPIDVDLEKSYSKSYDLSASDLVKIDNRFGNITIEIWNKSEIKVDALITASARKESRAQEILDDIRIEDRQRGGVISYSTKISKGRNMESKGNSKEHGFSIEMTVYIPSSQALDLLVEFGNIYIPDYQGELDVVSKFGKVKAGKLNQLKSLEVEFGAGHVESLRDARVVGKFSEIHLNDVSGEVDLKLEFCGDSDVEIAENIEELDVRAQNSQLTLMVPRNLSAKYDFQFSFGDLKNRTNLDFEKEEKSGFDIGLEKRYRGTLGSGRARIEIDADFSTVRIEN